MSDTVQEMDSVLGAWESALLRIRKCKQELEAQLAAPGAQAVGVLRSFYETVNSVKKKLNQQPEVEVSIAAASSAPVTPVTNKTLAETLVPENPVAVPSIPSTGESPEVPPASLERESESEEQSNHDQSATPRPSSNTAVIATADATSTPSASIATQSKEVINNNNDKGKDKPVDTTPTKTTAQASGNNNNNTINKSGSGSIFSKKDTTKDNGKATARSPFSDSFSPLTMDKITKTVRGSRFGARLPFIKPVDALNYARATGTPFGRRSVSGPSRLEQQQQRAVTPEPMSEVEEEEEEEEESSEEEEEEEEKSTSSVYLSLLESPHRALSATLDASSTPGSAFARAAAAMAGAGGSSTPAVGKELGQEEAIAGAGADEREHDVDGVEAEGETATFATAIGAGSSSESGSGSGSKHDVVSSIDDIMEIWNDDKETQGSSSNVVEGTGEDKTSNTPAKAKKDTTKSSSGSGSIPPKKDLKGKGKAITRFRSSSAGSPSLKNDNHKVMKNISSKTAKNSSSNGNNKATKSGKNKENQPFSRRSTSPAIASSSKAKSASNSDDSNNKPKNNIEEEIVVEEHKGKGKTIDTPNFVPATTTAITVDIDEMAGVEVNSGLDKNSESASNSATTANSKTGNNNKASGSGRGNITNKKDLKGKGKAIFPPPSLLPPPSYSSAGPVTAGLSSTATDPYAGPNSSNPYAGPSTAAAASSSSSANPPAAASSSSCPAIPKTNKGDKITKRRDRPTIKRSLAKKGAHWAFKLEAQFALSPADVETSRDKYFILCCPAPSCPAPNFRGKHPFREGRALAHFAAPPARSGAEAGKKSDEEDLYSDYDDSDLDEEEKEKAGMRKRSSCLMEIDEEEGVEHAADGDGDGDVEMTEADIFERFGAEVVPDQKRWKVNKKWAVNNNHELCKKKRGEEKEEMLAEL